MKIIERAKLVRILLVIAIFLPVYAVYLLTMPETVYWQDSGIYLAGIKTLGVIYPPGFPAYVFLGWLWVGGLSFIFGDVLTFAQKVHAFSGWWGAGAAAVAGLAVYELVEAFTLKDRKIPGFGWQGFLAALVAGLSSGFSYSLWAQSINAEVYSLAGFLAAMVFWLVVRIIRVFWQSGKDGVEGNDIRKWLLLLALFWGISFANHPVTVVFAPALFWFLGRLGLLPGQAIIQMPGVKVGRRAVGWRTWRTVGLAFLLSGVLPYLWLPIRSAADPVYLWSKIDSLGAFAAHVTGKVYFTRELAGELSDLEKIASFPALFFQEFFVFGILLGIVGVRELWKRSSLSRLWLEFGVGLGMVLYLLLSIYERGTEYNYWLIPFYIYWYILIGYGLGVGMGFVKRKGLLAGVLGLAVVVPLIWVNWPLLDRSDYVLAQEFGKNLIGKLPGRAILFTVGDQSSAIPSYLQLVEWYRDDVIMVWDSTFVYEWQRQRLAKFHPELVVPEAKYENGRLSDPGAERLVNEFIAANLDSHEVFLITKTVIPISERFILIPAGTLWRVAESADQKIDLTYWDYSFSDPDRYRRPERLEHSQQKKGAFGEIVSLERLKYSDEARLFELQAKKNLGQWCHTAEKEGKMLELRNLEGRVEQWREKRLLECAVEAFEAMFEIDPDFYHREIFLELSEVLDKLGREAEARMYYNEVLKRSQ